MLTGEGGEQKVERSDMVGVGEKRREGDEEIIKRLKTEIQTGKQLRRELLPEEKIYSRAHVSNNSLPLRGRQKIYHSAEILLILNLFVSSDLFSSTATPRKALLPKLSNATKSDYCHC